MDQQALAQLTQAVQSIADTNRFLAWHLQLLTYLTFGVLLLTGGGLYAIFKALQSIAAMTAETLHRLPPQAQGPGQVR